LPALHAAKGQNTEVKTEGRRLTCRALTGGFRALACGPDRGHHLINGNGAAGFTRAVILATIDMATAADFETARRTRRGILRNMRDGIARASAGFSVPMRWPSASGYLI
jgi:hypothetical protein